MEVSGLLGRMPSRLGYQSTMGTELSGLEERIANTRAGAITSIQAVYVPADDLTDPAAVHVFSHLSTSIVLSRKRAGEGLYPAIDLLQSSSKMATPGIVGERHYLLAQEIRRTLAQYEDLKDIIAMPGLEQLSPEDRNVVARARRLERFLTQPFFATEQFSGIPGKIVSLKDSLDGCERILRDEFKDYPESALYMIGAIDEAKKEVRAEAKGGPKPAAASKPAADPSPLPNPTGPLVSFLADELEHNAWAVGQWRQLRPPRVTCEPVRTEAAFLPQREGRDSDVLFALLEIFAPSCAGIAIGRCRWQTRVSFDRLKSMAQPRCSPWIEISEFIAGPATK
jgi:hypothetical protein